MVVCQKFFRVPECGRPPRIEFVFTVYVLCLGCLCAGRIGVLSQWVPSRCCGGTLGYGYLLAHTDSLLRCGSATMCCGTLLLGLVFGSCVWVLRLGSAAPASCLTYHALSDLPCSISPGTEGWEAQCDVLDCVWILWPP